MEDISISSQMPEVVWDCGSPSPRAWKRCQAAAGVSSSSEIEQLVKRSTEELHRVKRPRPSYKVDSKALDEARNIIEQLKNCHNEQSSLDKLFDQSGNNEELASARKHSDVDEALPPDFWNDDIFNDSIVEPKVDDKEKSEQENFESATSIAKTSTPLRYQQTQNAKRKQLKRRSRLILTPSKENQHPGNLASPATNVVPDAVSSNQVPPSKGRNSDSLDSCNEFLMTFKQRNKPNTQENKKLKIDTKDMNPAKNSNRPLPFAVNYSSSNTNVQNNRKVPISNPKADNLIIPDEILSQLIMDDSWTVNCTAGVTAPKAQLLQNELSLDKSILTQIFMDDSLTEACTAKPAPKSSTLRLTSVKNGNLAQKKRESVTKNGDFEELDSTLPVTSSVTKSYFLRVPGCNSPNFSESNCKPHVLGSSKSLQRASSTTNQLVTCQSGSIVKSSASIIYNQHRPPSIASNSISSSDVRSTSLPFAQNSVSNPKYSFRPTHQTTCVPFSVSKPIFHPTNSQITATTSTQTQVTSTKPVSRYNFMSTGTSMTPPTNELPQASKNPSSSCQREVVFKSSNSSCQNTYSANNCVRTKSAPSNLFKPVVLPSAKAAPVRQLSESSQSMRKCTAAEIEQKRLLALQRKRQRTKV